MVIKHPMTYLVATVLAATPAMAQTSSNPSTARPAQTGGTTSQSQATSSSASNLSAADFARQAAMSDMFEIQSSQAVMGKTQDPKIREFAEHMVRDHSQASDKLKEAAKGQTIPTALDQQHTDKLKQLQQDSNQDAGQAYVTMQLAGHQQAVQMFEAYARNGDDPALKQYAQQTLPTLREHLQSITQLQASNSGQRAGAATAANTQSGGTADHTFVQGPTRAWRASKLVGVNVYNEKNDKIGDISEVLVDQDGKVDAVVIGVGGFLGIGQHDVAVPFSALQWESRPVSSRTAVTTGTTAPTTGTSRTDTTASAVPPATSGRASTTAGTGTAATGAQSTTATGGQGSAAIGGSSAGTMADDTYRGYPDHAVLPNASKEELKAAPAFTYSAR